MISGNDFTQIHGNKNKSREVYLHKTKRIQNSKGNNQQGEKPTSRIEEMAINHQEVARVQNT